MGSVIESFPETLVIIEFRDPPRGVRSVCHHPSVLLANAKGAPKLFLSAS